MVIKKVTVKWNNPNNYQQLRILFYDQDGNLFESGDIISDNGLDCETENFKVTYTGTLYRSVYNPIYAVLTTSYKDIGTAAYYHYFQGGGSTESLFTIEFKTIESISKIKICTILDYDGKRGSSSLDIYDICDNTESYIFDDTNSNYGTIHEYNLPVMAYNINKIGIAETTISTNIQKLK